MEKLNIEDVIIVSRLTDKIRLQHRSTVQARLAETGVRTYRDLCKLKPIEIASMPYISSEVYVDMVQSLESFGLHFGMTDEELDRYMLQEGTAPKTITFSEESLKPLVESINYFNTVMADALKKNRQKKEKEQKVQQEQEEKCAECQRQAKAFDETLFLPNKCLSGRDWEYFFHNIYMQILCDQPWVIKWFVPYERRMNKALAKAHRMLGECRMYNACRTVAYEDYFNKNKPNTESDDASKLPV